MSIDKIKDIIIEGSGGGDEEDPPRTPVEDPNNLHSKNTLRFIDLLSEGEIFGLYDGAKSIYLNEVPLENAIGDLNYGGVNYYERKGTNSQSIVNGFSVVESEVSVGTEITKDGGPIVRSVSSSDVNDVRFTLTIMSLSSTDVTTGDISGTTVQLTIGVNPNGTGWQTVKNITKTGKCTAPYQFSIRISDLVNYGSGPWDIRVSRITADSESSYLSNATYWSSYTEIINEKLIYPDTAYIAYEVDAEFFGRTAPSRTYDLKGIKIQIPNNYYPEIVDTNFTTSYSGTWNGTFKTEYSNNPAWIYYDLLTNTRYGLGIEPQYIDKWALYTAGYYCDGEVDDGFGDSERRFTFNGTIETSKEAYHVLNMAASVFRSMPYWGTGVATVSPDMPIDPTRLVTAANVIGGIFEYQGSGLRARHTVCHVTWNDPSDFCRPVVEVVQDAAGINRYGYNKVDVVAYGCTSRGQAHRFGRWMLYTDINQTEMLTYRAGFDHADCVPGEVVKILDPDYAQVRFGGRVVSSTSTTVTLDNSVEIEGGEAYTLFTTTSSGTLQENDVDEGSPSERIVIEINGTFDEEPAANSVWMLVATNLEARLFRIMSVVEKEPHLYEMNAIIHDPNKFAIVEQGLFFDDPPFIRIPTGKLDPPTNLAVEEYTYHDGASNQQFGVLASWEHSPDPRTYFYEFQARNNSLNEVWTGRGGTRGTGETGDNGIDLRPVSSGTWDFRTRARGTIGNSNWLTLSDVAIYGDPDPLPNITGLQVKGGGSTFDGKDCEIEWDTVSGTVYRFKDYVIETYTIADVLLRTEQLTTESFTYWYDWNEADNGGTAIRQLKFKAYTRDVYDKKSTTAATLVASNPDPSMAGLTPDVTEAYKALNIEIDNIVPSDNDYEKTKIYCDANNPPTTSVGELAKGSTALFIPELDPDLSYNVQCEPYDLFGAGTKSSVLTGNDPKKVVDAADIDIELTTSIEMSTSVPGFTNTELQVLYDRDTTTSGFTFTTSGTETWIQYSYAMQDFQDRVVIWKDDNSPAINCYFTLSIDDGDSWSYFSDVVDGEHVLENYDYLTEHANSTIAGDNYVKLSNSKSVYKFPERTTATDFRMYITSAPGLTVTINELVPYREVIAELIVADELAAISANLGVVTAGLIQSNTITDDSGVMIDLDNELIRIGGTTNPFLYADGVNNYMSISGDGYLEILEGGTLLAGDGNFMLRTENISNHAVLMMAEDGGIQSDGSVADGKDYMIMDAQHLKTFLWDSLSNRHREFRTLRKVTGGTVDNNTYAYVGYFPQQPLILLSPANLQCYNTTYKLQSQSFRLEVRNIQQTANGDWRFRPYAQLVLTDGSGSTTINQTKTSSSDSTPIYSSNYTTPPNTNRVVFSINLRSYRGTGTTNQYYYRTTRYYVYVDGTPRGAYYYNHGASIGTTTVTIDISGLSSAAHVIRIRSDAYNAGGTFFYGTQVWDYQWVYNTATYNMGVTSTSNGAGNVSKTVGHTGVTVPGAAGTPGGWTDTGSRNCTVKITYSASSGGPITYYEAESEIWVMNSFLGDYNYVWKGITRPSHLYYAREKSTNYSISTSDTRTWNYSRIGHSIKLRVEADAIYSSARTATTSATINWLRTGKYVKRLRPGGSTTPYNLHTFNQYTYYLGTYQVLADGTVNYWVIDTGSE